MKSLPVFATQVLTRYLLKHALMLKCLSLRFYDTFLKKSLMLTKAIILTSITFSIKFPHYFMNISSLKPIIKLIKESVN